eukprot:12212341-Ditylum_brightwellii.AAC.1
MMGKWDREIQRVEGGKGGKGHSHPKTHYLKFGHYMLLECLRSDSDIQVRLPDKEEVLHLVDAIGKKYPLLREERIFGAMDKL